MGLFGTAWVNTDKMKRVAFAFLFCVLVRRLFLGLRFVYYLGIWRCLTISNNKELLINESIREKEVRVVDADGSQLGILPLKEALNIAASKNLDLVDIALQAKPPVCRIMDYGKYAMNRRNGKKRQEKIRKPLRSKKSECH